MEKNENRARKEERLAKEEGNEEAGAPGNFAVREKIDFVEG